MTKFPLLRSAFRKPETSTWGQHMRWLGAMKQYVDTIMSAPCPDHAPDGVFTAILLNYRRPQNIELLTRMLLQVPLISEVIISNNNPKSDLQKYFGFSHPRVSIITQSVERSCAYRYFIAQETDAQYFFCIDDDLFLLPAQVQRLCQETLKNPAIVHGMFGQESLEDGTFRHAVSRCAGPIDIIGRAYAFARPLLSRWHAFARAVGFDGDDKTLGFVDDMLLSFSGDGRPMMHDTGPYLDCCTQGERGIAVWRETEFFTTRDRMFQRLRAMQNSRQLVAM